MNNYCTNCGEKLDKDVFECKNCNTPIIDLSYDYKSSKKRERTRKPFTIIDLFVLCVGAFIFTKEVINMIKINKLQRDYVEVYLKENYNNSNYSIKYESFGKCVVSGDCYFDLAMGIDGGSCSEYDYLDEKECKSYYYSVKVDTDEFIVTVVDRNKQFTVVEGRNIYGTDKENDR